MPDKTIPALKPNRSDIVVDELQHHRHLFRSDTYTVIWRSTSEPDVLGRSEFRMNDTRGVGAIADQEFTFAVRWMVERRRESRERFSGGSVTVPETMASQ